MDMLIILSLCVYYDLYIFYVFHPSTLSKFLGTGLANFSETKFPNLRKKVCHKAGLSNQIFNWPQGKVSESFLDDTLKPEL